MGRPIDEPIQSVKPEEQAISTKDQCSVCGGSRGGEPGNENIVDGRIVCDYCHHDIMQAKDQSKTE